MVHFNMAEETLGLEEVGARLLWGVTYEVKQSADGSLNEVTPYHYHTKREYIIVGVTGEFRMLVGNEVYSVKPHDVLVIATGERHMEVDVGRRDFRVLMTGYDPPGEERILVPYEEIPPELRPLVESQLLRYPIPR